MSRGDVDAKSVRPSDRSFTAPTAHPSSAAGTTSMAAPSGLRKPVWSAATEIALIEFFQANACLWDPKDISYLSRPLREEKLLELCRLLNATAKPGTQFTPKDCKERFKNLRTTFHREYKKKDSAAELGRPAGTEPRTPRWVHYARMMFLAKAKKPTLIASAFVPKRSDNCGLSEDQSSDGSVGAAGDDGCDSADHRRQSSRGTESLCGPTFGSNGQVHISDVHDDESYGGGDGGSGCSPARAATSVSLTRESPEQRPTAARPMRLGTTTPSSSSRKRRKPTEPTYSPAQELPMSAATDSRAAGSQYEMEVSAARPLSTTAGSSSSRPVTSSCCGGAASNGPAATEVPSAGVTIASGCAPMVGGGSSCCCCCALRQGCDSDEAFSRYVCATLKQMAPHVRCLAKLEIQRTLTQFETEASSAASSAADATGGRQLVGSHGSFYPL